ncbi:MAG: hypothetical protein A2Y92_02885 [Chloroflexi bacterium RBG_13_57_8]|nr:MAG: hypothetical protein A2Y92_02885 [Chloroflexi bacterium RBG_13_57_8]
MELFAANELRLNKNVKKGDKESLLSLFSPEDRFKNTRVLVDAVENTTVSVSLENLGEIDLKLGDDMEKGQKKTIMTLFWFNERSKLITMMKDAGAGDTVKINMYKLD